MDDMSFGLLFAENPPIKGLPLFLRKQPQLLILASKTFHDDSCLTLPPV